MKSRLLDEYCIAKKKNDTNKININKISHRIGKCSRNKREAHIQIEIVGY